MKVPFTMFYPGLGCDPTEEEFIAGFIMDVAKAIANWNKGIEVRKKQIKAGQLYTFPALAISS